MEDKNRMAFVWCNCIILQPSAVNYYTFICTLLLDCSSLASLSCNIFDLDSENQFVSSKIPERVVVTI